MENFMHKLGKLDETVPRKMQVSETKDKQLIKVSIELLILKLPTKKF